MNVLLCGVGACTCQVPSEKCGGCLRIIPQEQKVPTTPGASAHGLNNLPSPSRFAPYLVSVAQVCCVFPGDSIRATCEMFQALLL